jgi:preprotein translocase SecE subunit
MQMTRFISESYAELKKVEWPDRDQLVRGVATVILVCVVVGVFLYGADLASKHIADLLFN